MTTEERCRDIASRAEDPAVREALLAAANEIRRVYTFAGELMLEFMSKGQVVKMTVEVST